MAKQVTEPTTEELEALFWREFASSYIRQAIVQTLDSYKFARRECWRWVDAHLAGNIVGQVRQAHLDDGLHKLTDSFPGLSARYEFNAPRNFRYTLISSKSIIMSAALLDGVRTSEIPRHAQYRHFHAASPQMSFQGEGWDIDQPKPANDTGERKHYAMFVHGPGGVFANAPNFMFVGFPYADYSGFKLKIPLDKILSEISATRSDREEVKDDLGVKLRLVPKLADDDGGDGGNK